VRPAPRSIVLALLTVLAGAGVPLALAPAGCGTDAVGVDACRQIEATRCAAAQACGYTQDQTDACNIFYKDQCLVGIENDAWVVDDATVKACVDAVNATKDCAAAGVASMAGCAGAALVASADPAIPPCDIIKGNAELLAACSFVVKPADAGTAVVDAGSDSADAASD
jgi:hypothetical protein